VYIVILRNMVCYFEEHFRHVETMFRKIFMPDRDQVKGEPENIM